MEINKGPHSGPNMGQKYGVIKGVSPYLRLIYGPNMGPDKEKKTARMECNPYSKVLWRRFVKRQKLKKVGSR
jgi:hypothetical protein